MRSYKESNYNIFVDVDETLTFDDGLTFVEDGIKFIKDKSDKVNFFIWSQQGLDYVHKIVKSADIEDYIVGVLPKPDFIIDDLKFNQFANEFYPDWKKLNKMIKG